MAWLLGPGPLSPYRRALLDRSPPQLVLVLGGDVDRERMGARLARQLDLPLLVSGGSNPEYAEWMLSEERFNPDRVTLDYRARDTLTNFTSVVDELQAERTPCAAGDQRRPFASLHGRGSGGGGQPWNSAHRCPCGLPRRLQRGGTPEAVE